MKIKSIRLQSFRRFENLVIDDLPPAKLVVMAGPNGSGKSSLFDAFVTWRNVHHTGYNWDPKYHARKFEDRYDNQVDLAFHDGVPSKNSIYVRSAYRHEADFEIGRLERQGNLVDQISVHRMIDNDSTVRQNYQRLASTAFENAFSSGDENSTLKEFREEAVGEIGRAVSRLFPDLKLNTLGNPLEDGTFSFQKGAISKFSYKNLSGGEKAAFDLLLDILIKRKSFNDTVFAIDEPEAHMNTRLQGRLLQEIYDLVPDNSQLWIATHSIGMMRKARDLYEARPSEVIFLDFEGHDYDQLVTLKPVTPTRSFWERVLRVALDDLADLVSPQQVVICEGNPRTPVGGKNEEHDARCYQRIFDHQFPDTKFLSGGSSKEVSGDRLKFAAIMPILAKGIDVTRLIDRDDHSPEDIDELRASGVKVLSRRNLEGYLYDEEVLAALYQQYGASEDFPALRAFVEKSIAQSVERGNPPDDMKSIAGDLYGFMKAKFRMTGVGNDQMAFARAVLAPLISPGTAVYDQMKNDIFG
jgi:predicted ATPase